MKLWVVEMKKWLVGTQSQVHDWLSHEARADIEVLTHSLIISSHSHR